MSKILLYYPSNKRTNQIETQMIELKKRGFDICLLTTIKKGDLHFELEKYEIKTYSNQINKNNSLVYYFSQIIFLIRFCKKNNIDIVLSNLQHVNFISVFAQFFINARVIIFRHHFKFNKDDKSLSVNRMEQMFDRFINFLAKEIIVPSNGVYNGMKNYENIKIKKVNIIPYIYNFSKYKIPDPNNVKKIKQIHSAKLRLIMCSRLIPFKRHIIIFPIIKELVTLGYNIKLFVLDEGPEEDNLKNYIKENNLEDNIIMLGYRKDFLDYMAAADIMIHPSLTEASNSAVKEIALLGKTAIVCKGVGDFDSYFVNYKNGIILDPVKFKEIILEIIINIYKNEIDINILGKNLRKNVYSKFSISDDNITPYLDLLNEKK